jgi:hypothetical protein
VVVILVDLTFGLCGDETRESEMCRSVENEWSPSFVLQMRVTEEREEKM